MNHLNIKQLREKVKNHQKKICPPYSKMKKQQLIDYLENAQDSTTISSDVKIHPRRKKKVSQSNDSSTISTGQEPEGYNPVQSEPDDISQFVFKSKKGKKGKKSVRRKAVRRKTMKKKKSDSSSSLGLKETFKENEKGYKKQKVHKTKTKRKPSKWIQHVKDFYAKEKANNPDYKYKNALKDAKSTYQK